MEDWKKLYLKDDDEDEVRAVARYTQKVKDHLSRPRNVGVIENPDGKGSYGSEECGDYLEVYFKCAPEDKTRISDFKWQAYGCAGLISTSSALSELVKSKTLKEALALTDNDIIAYLDGLPEQKKHCSLLCLKALQEAIKDYQEKTK